MSDLEFRDVPIAHLIGQPVVAIIKANQMMANEQVKLLMDICFTKMGDVYEPVMITMSIRRGGIEPAHDGQPTLIREAVTHFQVPLITLLPINSLAIENVDIKFNIDVFSHPEVKDVGASHPFGTAAPSLSRSYELTGSIAKYQPGDPAETAGPGEGLSIHISTGKLPLPLGVNTILEAYSQAIHPSDISSRQNAGKSD